jgi:hypothetical protein
MGLDQVINFGKVVVSTTYDASATEIVLSSGDGAKLPTIESGDSEYNLVWWDSTNYSDPSDDPKVEIVRVTARSSDTLTITRGQEWTSPSTKNTGGSTYKMILGLTSKMITDIDTNKLSKNTSGEINGITPKSALVNNDEFLIEDSENSYAKKKTLWSSIKSVLKTYFDGIYQPLKTILTTLGNLANASGWLKNDGSGNLSYTTPSKTDVGLSNVDNTSDASKNIGGTATNLSGTPALPNGTTATTQSAGDNSTKLATTAYVDSKVKRVTTVSDTTSITPNSDTSDITYQLNTQSAGTLTINADAGTPANGRAWLLKIKSTNVQTFSWNSQYVGGIYALPVSTHAGKIDYFSFIYDSVNSKWDFVGQGGGF